MARAIANLSTRGFITGVTDQVDILLSQVIVANYSQTELYYSKITSLPYLVKTFGDNPRRLSDEVQSALTLMFDRYFEGVIIKVDFEYLDKVANAGPYRITLEIVVVNSEGQRVNIASDLEIIDGTFKEVARRNNEDSGT